MEEGLVTVPGCCKGPGDVGKLLRVEVLGLAGGLPAQGIEEGLVTVPGLCKGLGDVGKVLWVEVLGLAVAGGGVLQQVLVAADVTEVVV